MGSGLDVIENFIQAMDAARTVDELYVATSRQIEQLGFDYFGYQLLAPPIGPHVQLYLTSKPRGWTLRYIEMNHISEDLVSRHAARTIRPYLWSEIVPNYHMTKPQQLVFSEATEFGLHSGGTIPIHGPAAAKALFSLANTGKELDFTERFLQERHVLQIIATYVHEHLLRLGLHKVPPSPAIKLSPREIEVLTWTARGKTSWEISVITSLSEATVREYIENACRKLGTYGKTHAVAVAIRHALIIP